MTGLAKFLTGLAIGLVGGGVTGYFVARKKAKKELKEALEKAEARYQYLRDVDAAEANADKKEAIEKAKVEALKRVEEEDRYIDQGVDVIALADEEEDEDDLLIEGWDAGNGSEFDDPEKDWAEYLDSISEYIGTARPYNITEEMYSEGNPDYQKRKLYLCIYDDPDTEDYAYDADTGEIEPNWHMLIGDQDFDTMSSWRCDGGAWYIRNDREETDFMCQYQNSALLK